MTLLFLINLIFVSFINSVSPITQKFCSIQSLSHVWLFTTSWTPGFPVHYQILELTQTHVHCIGDAIQPSYPLLSPSPAFNLSQKKGLFKWVSSSHQVPKYWSFNFSISPSNERQGLISFRMDWWISLQSKGLSRVFSNTTVQKHQFFDTQFSL